MGVIQSTINEEEKNNLNDELIDVNFVQIKKTVNNNISAEQLNMLLGLNVPRYSILVGTEYKYLYCVSSIVDINNIVRTYGYDVGFSKIQKVFKNEFNSYHRPIITYGENEYFKLVHI